MNRFKSTRAFTLIELVVVIVILGILAAIAAFAYQSVVRNSKTSAMDKTAQQVAKSHQASLAAGKTSAQALTDATSDATNAGATITSASLNAAYVNKNNCSALITWGAADGATSGVVSAVTCP